MLGVSQPSAMFIIRLLHKMGPKLLLHKSTQHSKAWQQPPDLCHSPTKLPTSVFQKTFNHTRLFLNRNMPFCRYADFVLPVLPQTCVVRARELQIRIKMVWSANMQNAVLVGCKLLLVLVPKLSSKNEMGWGGYVLTIDILLPGRF